ncbi:MAG: TetR/AcrR family transcriptional regulator [Anaerolineae bacterium]|nr:TetR/AcrR family transcriptional regulator [Anaerolineae bacterium]
MPKVINDMQIFQAVMQTIAERGYAGATTRQIAEAADVSEVTLFRKYGTKAELVKRTISALMEQTEFESATQYSGDIHADLLRVVMAYSEGVIRNEHFFFVLFAELSRTPELADSFSQPLGLFQSIGNLLSRYQADGVLKSENPLHSVASLLGPLIYFSMIARSAGNIPMPPMDSETHITHFLGGRQIAN